MHSQSQVSREGIIIEQPLAKEMRYGWKNSRGCFLENNGVNVEKNGNLRHILFLFPFRVPTERTTHKLLSNLFQLNNFYFTRDFSKKINLIFLRLGIKAG